MTPGVLLVAKAPVAGLAKTRLAAHVGDEAAADIAAAALLDTIDAVEAYARPSSRLLSITGDLASAARGDQISARLGPWLVVAQRGDGLGERLVNAHADAAMLWGDDHPVIQLGMDTPQVLPADLAALAAAVERPSTAAIGPAADGGWWGLSTSRAGLTDGLAGVRMSTPLTGQATVDSLARAGASVEIVHRLTDMDTWADALAITALAPDTRTAAAVREVRALRREAGVS